MPSTRRTLRRPLAAGLLPLALAVGSLPLLAPTCAGVGEGDRTFARGSLIIPMDRCYQFQTDAVTGTGQPSGCPQPADAGDVVRAYGLVYQLIRNDVAVHWVINKDKTSVTGTDLTVQYGAGAPVFLYDWANGGTGAAPTTSPAIDYKGGPFVVDGADFAKASAVLQAYKTAFGAVNVHVSNVAFRGYVKKTMAGGWSAGGAVPPKLALLDIGSGNISSVSATGAPTAIRDPKNAEPVIEGYLSRAGIGSGAAAGSAAGPHGEIYDKLGIDDFQPAAGSTDWRTSRFGQNGYQILWVPHWVAPGSCSNFSSTTNCLSTLFPEAKIAQTLRTIGAFVAAGNDLFAECAGLGSFEGAFKRGATGTAAGDYTIDYEQGDPSTRFQTPSGVRYNELPDVNSSQSGTQLPPPNIPTSFGSPLLQIGDFPFSPYTGAIEDYRPQNGAEYVAGVQRLITGLRSTASPEAKTQYGDSFDRWDYFTFLPATEARGTVVYLGGHSYSGVQGTFQIAGSRLVLNTLFNLGAGCTESGVSCTTGHLGVCSTGTLGCGPAGVPVCTATVLPGERPEVCNGLDDDCDGLVDEDLEVACYGGPAGTQDVGLCRAGVRSCVRGGDGSYALSACVGEIRPAGEVCNGLDDDCDGAPDEALSQACYFGPLDTVDAATGLPRGVCRAGTQTCSDGSWGTCAGQVLPSPESCGEGTSDALDDDCDGVINEGCTCESGEIRSCYGGPAGTAGVGLCLTGRQTCTGGTWSTCAGEVLPAPEICNDGIDQACNGGADDGPPICSECRSGVETEACYTGPAETAGLGICQGGQRACVNGEFAGACEGEVLPAAGEPCDGLDNDCDGTPDDGAVCADGFVCTNGLCVPSTCGAEIPCPEGYSCEAGACLVDGCGVVTCAAGKACRFGACVDPCEGVSCGAGAVCASGACVGGSCYFSGCDDPGELCLDGLCQPDPCAGVDCPSGAFCRKGDCVQACTFVSCGAGERCGEDGFCVDDPCAGQSCAPGERCVAGACAADPCAGKGCGTGQICDGGVCVDDPCTGVVCPAGVCTSGQCYPTFNPTGAGGDGDGDGDAPGAEDGGCGCGSAGGSAFSALLALAAIPLARRRRRPAAGGRGGATLALVLLSGSLALGLSGCSDEESAPFDPASCANACELETARCVDFQRDPAHCGACGQACPESSQCVDGVCGPASAVAPYVTGVAPGAAPTGAIAPVEVELSGDRFATGATLRVTTPAGTRIYDTELVTGRLRAAVEVAGALPGTWHLRVVNPDRVISNAVPFDVFIPSPAITAVAPDSVLAGGTTAVLVTGTGLSSTSQCHLASTRLAEIALPSSLGATGLSCTVDATLIPPGAYELWVVNDGGLSSSRLPLAVTSSEPVISGVSPSSGEAGAIVALTVLGSGFDLTSRVYLDGFELSTLFVEATRLYVAQVTLPTEAGPHQLTVKNSSGSPSAPETFVVGAQTVQITGVAPASAYQGDVLDVTFTGNGFPTGVVVEAAPPSGAFYSLSTDPCAAGCTAVTGELELVGKPEGSWLLRLRYPDGTSSSPYAFRVLSNQAILRGVDPRGGAQGEVKAVTLTVGNLRLPLEEVLVQFGQPGALQPLPCTAAGTTVQVSLNLAGKETGTYTLAVLNPNDAAPSNAISFNVTPGQPTLSGLSSTSAPQQEAPVPVTLTGTNFARPDASGAGGSVVHISSAALGISDLAIPASATTVVSSTRIDVQLDTRTGVPGTYDVAVWNPGGPTPPQKSLTKAFTITAGP